MNFNNNGCHRLGCGCQQCSNGKFNCTEVRPFRAIDTTCLQLSDPSEESLAYGSFNSSIRFVNVTPVTSPTLGQKVIFTTPGPSLNVYPASAPNNITDLQVAINGVYEISMDILAILLVSSDTAFETTFVRFGLFINDSFLATDSHFESLSSISVTTGDQNVSLSMANTIGKTIQLRLNENDRLSIRVTEAEGAISYSFPSLVVNKIAD